MTEKFFNYGANHSQVEIDGGGITHPAEPWPRACPKCSHPAVVKDHMIACTPDIWRWELSEISLWTGKPIIVYGPGCGATAPETAENVLWVKAEKL